MNNALNSDNDYIGTPSAEFQSRELDSYDELIYETSPRFRRATDTPMFSHEWANTELIPFLKAGYSKRPGIGADHDWWDDLRRAEIIEPAHMLSYPVEDAVWIERLRLAVITPETVPGPSRVTSVAQDIDLTIRLLIRRYVLFGGAFKLGTLPATGRPELAEEARVAGLVDEGISKLFVDN